MWGQPLGGRAMFIKVLYSYMKVWRMCDGSSGDRPEPTRSLVLYKRPFVRRSVRPRLRSQFCTAELTEHLWSTFMYCQALQETPRWPVKMVHTHQCLTFTQMSACSATGVLACWYSTTSKHYKVLTITGEVPKEASVDMIKLLKLAVAHEQQSHTRSFQRRFNPFLNTLKLRSSPKVKATCPESGSAQVDLNSKPRDLLSMTVCFGTASNELRSELNRFHFIRTSSLPACFPNPSLKSPLHCPT